jgi:hypothetical protein
MPRNEFGHELGDPRFELRSKGDLAQSVIKDLFQQLMSIREREVHVPPLKRFTWEHVEAIRRQQTKEHGSVRLPDAVEGNFQAHVELLHYLGEELMQFGPNAQWSDEQRAIVAAELGNVLLLHSEIHKQPMSELFPGPGYALKNAFNTAPMAHNLKIELKHFALDFLSRVGCIHTHTSSSCLSPRISAHAPCFLPSSHTRP